MELKLHPWLIRECESILHLITKGSEDSLCCPACGNILTHKMKLKTKRIKIKADVRMREKL